MPDWIYSCIPQMIQPYTKQYAREYARSLFVQQLYWTVFPILKFAIIGLTQFNACAVHEWSVASAPLGESSALIHDADPKRRSQGYTTRYKMLRKLDGTLCVPELVSLWWDPRVFLTPAIRAVMEEAVKQRTGMDWQFNYRPESNMIVMSRLPGWTDPDFTLTLERYDAERRGEIPSANTLPALPDVRSTERELFSVPRLNNHIGSEPD